MKCLKCKIEEYCSRFCKEHFKSYFERKFKSHLSKNKMLNKNETLNVLGENKEVVKYLLNDLGRKVDAKFNTRGRRVESFSMDSKAVKQLSDFMQAKSLEMPVSFLECFTQEEINHYAKLCRLKTSKPKLSKFETKLNKLMKESMERRPNIYYCTYNMMKEFSKVIKKSR
ncbi:MAG: hypothetical protein JW791_00655 [Nanoarchaeota archaeon]|nr:hypothetical protein [Nanoarchaeota archaeon]